MKVVIAAEIFPPDIGGPATYSQTLAQALTSQGVDVKLVCYSDEKHDDDPEYVTRVIRRPFKLHYLSYYKTLKKLAADADVIYAMGPVSSGKPSLKVAKELKKKLVVKVVGDYAWEQARNSGQTDLLLDEFQAKTLGGKIGMLQKAEREVCQQADKVITPSQYLKKIVTGWGVAEDKIEVVYNSFNKEFYSLYNGSKIQPPTFKYIVSVGRLVPWKGFSALISLMPELLKEDENFRLIILGKGPEEEKLLSEANKLNLLQTEKVVINTNADTFSVMGYLKNSFMFVLNTGYEGLPHTILESFAAGTPVVTTNIGGNPELVTDGENGLLVEYNNKEQLKDAILKLHQNKELRHKFVESAKPVLEKFSFEKMINHTIEVLKNVSKMDPR